MTGSRAVVGQGEEPGIHKAPGNLGAVDVCTPVLIVVMAPWWVYKKMG